MREKRFVLIYSFLILTLFGCAATPAKLRYVWPMYPDEPKVEYIGVYNNENDFSTSNVVDKFLGREASPLALKNPQMAISDGGGRVYITDIGLGGVLVFDFNSKSISKLGGESSAGLFSQPYGIAIDGDGILYISDTVNRKIISFTREGKPSGVIDLSAQLKSMGYIAVDKVRKKIIVPDYKDQKIYIMDFNGTITTEISTFGGSEKSFNRPNAVAVAPNGNILVADTLNARVVQFSSEGKYLSEFGSRGDEPGQFNIIQGIAVDSNGNIYVTDARNNSFSIFSLKGEYLLSIGVAGDSRQKIGAFQIPLGISIDQNDTVYIVEKIGARFQIFQFLTPAYLTKKPINNELLAKPLVDKKKSQKDKTTVVPIAK